MAKKKYWLMKSEPDVFGIRDLKKNKTEPWDGVRNYQARNFMRDDMKIGDGVLFYHSNAKPPGVAGIAEVCKLAYPDPTQFDKKSKYYDPKSPLDNPRWWLVDVKFLAEFSNFISLPQLREIPALSDMLVIKKGMRLSIQPVTAKDYKTVCKLGGVK